MAPELNCGDWTLLFLSTCHISQTRLWIMLIFPSEDIISVNSLRARVSEYPHVGNSPWPLVIFCLHFYHRLREGRPSLVTHWDRKYHQIFSSMCISCVSPLGPGLPEITGEGNFYPASRQLESSSLIGQHSPLIGQKYLTDSQGAAMDWLAPHHNGSLLLLLNGFVFLLAAGYWRPTVAPLPPLLHWPYYKN